MRRDAFVEWERRFGRGGTGVLGRLHAAAARRERIGANDLHDIAEQVRRPVSAVAGAAGYYADFAGARGARHVRVCVGTSCFVSAGDHTVALAEAALGVEPGRTSADGSVSLAGAHCLGFCYASPAALDGQAPITGPELGDRLLSADHPVAPPIPYRVTGHRAVTLAGLTGAEESWQVWPQVVTGGSPAAVRAEVSVAGLRGRGWCRVPGGAEVGGGARRGAEVRGGQR